MAPCIRWNLLVLVMSVFIVEGRARSLQNPVSSTLPEENTAALGNLLAKVVGQELDGCYLVVITAGVHQTSNVFTPIVRFLEDIHTYLWPRTKMVMVGPRAHPHAFLNHHAFRNTAHALYLAPQLDILQSRAPTTLQGVGEVHLREENCSEGGDRERVGRERKNSSMLCGDVEVYWRCLYCNQGKPDVFLLDLWKLHSPYHAHHVLFPDQFENFHGHKFRIVSMDWFPFLGFTRDSNASATTVTLTDSLDYRMLTAISRVLNFT
ncbi:putative variant ionotropic glutamate receptor-like 9, partial [Homarus americanus]